MQCVELIALVIDNYLSNAVKHTDSGNTIKIFLKNAIMATGFQFIMKVKIYQMNTKICCLMCFLQNR